ncbi:10704_t:CDS:1, partial [Racocetra persica]
ITKAKNQHWAKVLKTHSTSGGELNNTEDSDTKISVLKTEEANNIITRLLQAVSE